MVLKRFFLALAALVAIALPEGALAQSVTQLPAYINPGVANDLGNGPLELKVLHGNALVSTSQGSGTSTAVSASTAMTLSGTPATPPCVGCVIAGAGIVAGTTVAAYNGTTGITLSQNATVSNGTAVSWGAACPSTVNNVATIPLGQSAGGTGDVPLYTYARICAYSPNGPGAAILPFAIGAH